MYKRLFLLVLLMPALFFTCVINAKAATYNVINNSSDYTTPGSLPWCVAQANASVGPDIINFVTGNSITVHTVLTIIDQVDIRGNSNSVGAHDGTGAGTQNCFAFSTNSHGSTITGVAVVDSSTGIALLSNGNHVANCRVGLDWAGVARNNIAGVYDQGQDNWIGGIAADRNIISNNTSFGIVLTNSLRSRIQGNYIGTNITGDAALGTQSIGIYLNPGVQAFIGGGQSVGEGNAISGNTNYGILLENENSFGNTICGNVIGLTQDESTALPNMLDGIRIHRSSGNAIGLPVTGYHNVIAGNQNYNLIIYSQSGLAPRPRLNIIQNNFIGVNSSSVGFTTSSYNFYVNQGDANLIGGNRASLERNVISGDGSSVGLYLIGRGNTVSGNYIGTDDGGSNARPNTVGISTSGNADGNLIGGTNLGGNNQGNVISGNSSFGILHQGGVDNAFHGNYIGLDGAGGSALGNGNRGLYLGGGTSRSRVGDLSPERRNVFADNAFGALIVLNNVSNSRIEGNYFGMNAAGTVSLPNASYSIEVSSASRVWIAGNACAETVSLYGLNCTGNTLVANRIGILPNGTSTGENNGVYLGNSVTGNFIGLPGGQGNLISGLSQYGIRLNNGTVVNNGLYGNTITACATGNIALLSGANNSHPAPVITSAVSGTLISGTASANDYIEVFIAEGATGQGGSVRYLGSTTATSGGAWSFNPGGYAAGEYVCALATDPANNTSEFSSNVLVLPSPTPTPTLTVTATATISPTSFGTATMTPTFSPTVTPTITSTQTTSPTSALSSVDLDGKQVLAYPNPAKGQMTFVFHMDEAAEVKILIYNLAGERVVELSGDFAAGRGQTLIWDCGDVAPGIYLARYLVAGEVKETIKIAVVK